jgi:hypothetical protein
MDRENGQNGKETPTWKFFNKFPFLKLISMWLAKKLNKTCKVTKQMLCQFHSSQNKQTKKE